MSHPLSGVVEYVTQSPYDALLRLDKPGPGIAALGAFTFPGGDQSMVAMNFYLYGDQAAATVARETPRVASVAPGTLPDADGAEQERMNQLPVPRLALLALSIAATDAFAQTTAAPPAPDYGNPQTWLCRPDRLAACDVDLSTTVLGRDGRSTIERAPLDPQGAGGLLLRLSHGVDGYDGPQ